MIILKKILELRSYIQEQKDKKQKIAFVPTMGNLHEGHLSLIKEAKKSENIHENIHVISSIFVNPLQFAPHEDFDAYPRTLEHDLQKLQKQGLVDAVFCPAVTELFCFDAQGKVQQNIMVTPYHDIKFTTLETVFRPHFFQGVCTIVLKLIHCITPDIMYLGLKDYQQYIVLKAMTEQLNLSLEIKGCPIVREYDGLAMSSRNQYLSVPERILAPQIHLLLKRIAHEKNLKNIDINDFLNKKIWMLDYLTIADAKTLKPVTDYISGTTVILIAARLGETRLIDCWYETCF